MKRLREENQHTRGIFLLVELLVTFLLFCFAVSVLLQVFAKGVQISGKVDNVGSALLKAESIAEQIKTTDGSDASLQTLFGQDGNNNIYNVYYNEKWEQTPGYGTFQTQITCTRDPSGLLTTDIEVYRKNQKLTALQSKHYFPSRGVVT